MKNFINEMLQKNNDLQITFYNENDEMILNENNVQNIDECIEKYNIDDVLQITIDEKHNIVDIFVETK